jgi:hypothetical protein
MIINWDEFKCRCSGIHKILANSRSNPVLTENQRIRLSELENKDSLTSKQTQELAELLVKKENSTKVILSDTCIEYLMEVYAWVTKRKKPIKDFFEIQQMKKGKLAEADSISLLSIIDGIIYNKYEGDRIQNDFLSGLPDVFSGEEIMSADAITDLKNCFDYPVFLKKINNGLDNGNEEQVQGYCDITGSKKGWVAFALVDMPETMRQDIKRKMFYDGNYVTEESPEFLEKWAEAEHSMIFGDIPMHQRVYKIPIEPFSEIKRQTVYDRVKVCREWLWTFDEVYKKLNFTPSLQ